MKRLNIALDYAGGAANVVLGFFALRELLCTGALSAQTLGCAVILLLFRTAWVGGKS